MTLAQKRCGVGLLTIGPWPRVRAVHPAAAPREPASHDEPEAKLPFGRDLFVN